MKTPGEIFLERHRTAEPALDTIRQRVVADLKSVDPKPPIRLPVLLWTELFLPCRRIWTGLAAVWVVILVLNLQSNGASASAGLSMVSANNILILVRDEDQRLLDELVGIRDEPKPGLPAGQRPRTGRKSKIKIG